MLPFIMLGNIIYKGHSAFVQTKIQLEVFFDESVMIREAKGREDPAISQLRRPCARCNPKEVPRGDQRRDKRMLYRSVQFGGAAFELYQMVQADPSLIGQTKAVWFKAPPILTSYKRAASIQRFSRTSGA